MDEETYKLFLETLSKELKLDKEKDRKLRQIPYTQLFSLKDIFKSERNDINIR